MKIDILKTFEDFIKEPISILKKTLINIKGIEADFVKGSSISVERTDSSVEINVINSQNVYRLLSSVVHKKQVCELRGLINENKTREVHPKLAKSTFGTHVLHS